MRVGVVCVLWRWGWRNPEIICVIGERKDKLDLSMRLQEAGISNEGFSLVSRVAFFIIIMLLIYTAHEKYLYKEKDDKER